jgi:hypothetical protein
MIIVATQKINGIITPLGQVKPKGFGTMFNGTEWLIFETAQERDANVPVIIDVPEKDIIDSLTEEQLTRLKLKLQ